MGKNNVDTMGVATTEMSAYWTQVDALMGGTDAMRRARTAYLPKEKREKPARYNARLARSFLYCAYKDTVTKLGAAPFRSEVTINAIDQLPPMLKALIDETDTQGRDLTAFCKLALTEAIHRGVTHILPEFPVMRDGATRQDELDAGVHPYLVHISPKDMRGWLRQTMPNGMRRLRQFRFREHTNEALDQYVDSESMRVRVYNLVYPDEVQVRQAMLADGMTVEQVGNIGLGSVEIWKQIKLDRTGERVEWELEQVLPYSYVGNPLVTLYIEQTGFMSGKPRFWDMGDLNIAHWQSDSDQRNVLHIARVPLLARFGVTQEEYDEGVTIGVSECISSKNPEARMEWIEVSGNAIAAGRGDLEDLEERMEVMGLTPRLKRPVKTATGEVKDEVRMQSEAESWVRGLENAIETCIWNAAAFIGETESMPEDFAVDIFNEFSLSVNATRDVDALIRARANGDISRATFLSEIKRRNTISGTVDVQAELDRIHTERDEALASISLIPQANPHTQDSADSAGDGNSPVA